MSFFLFLYLSFSLSQANSLEHGWLLSSLSCPGLQDPHERVPCAYVKQCKPCVKGFIGFLWKRRNISLFLSLFYFVIVDSSPPGSGPFKDLNNPPFESYFFLNVGIYDYDVPLWNASAIHSKFRCVLFICICLQVFLQNFSFDFFFDPIAVYSPHIYGFSSFLFIIDF